MSEYHIPVLLDESITALIEDKSGTYVDVTFGGGGHTAEILSRLNQDGKVIAFDRDSDALENKIDDDRLHLVHNNFRFVHNCILHEKHKELSEKEAKNGTQETTSENTQDIAKNESVQEIEVSKLKELALVDGILGDLGVSSHQFDTAERGFSFRYDAPLDMRMNKNADLSAADIVNQYEEYELRKILKIYGEVKNAGRIAKLMVENRPIETTGDLHKALEPALPKFAEHKFLAKVYQALRIEVNKEMKSLEKFLEGASKSLKPGGRLVIITYHSLEDRMVKNFIKAGNIEGKVDKDFYGNVTAPLKAVNRKPILPTEEEISRNTRARSAKLRIAEKL